MKKVLAVLLALALTLATMTVALANPSISDLSAAVVAADQLTKLPDGTTITTPDGTTALPAGSAIKLPAGVDSLPAGTSALPAGTEIVQPNGETLILPDGAQITLAEDVAKTAGGGIMIRPAEPSTYQNDKVAKIVEKMEDSDAVLAPGDIQNDLILDEGVRLEDYDFITSFSDVVLLKDNGEQVFEDEGKPIYAQVTFAVDALKGVQAQDLGAYSFLIINPATAESKLLSVDNSAFNPAKGEVTVLFPYLGTFTLLQKVAE